MINQLTLHTTNLEREERDNEGGWREGGRWQMVSEAVVDSRCDLQNTESDMHSKRI